MGTRRSRHNYGRKPRYKDHERTLVAEVAPLEAEGWEAEADAFLFNRRLNFLEETPSYSPSSFCANIPKPDPALSAQVKAYLAKKREEIARKDADLVFPQNWIRAPERAFVPLADHREAERVEASRRDVLMELFVERKISAGQLHAGRRWQADKEWATIQPSTSIDWSTWVSFGYQARGTITEGQWAAMKRRRSFAQEAGIATMTLLDFFLEPDRGRTELMRIFGVTAAQVEIAVDELLSKLCILFGGPRRAAAFWTN